MGLGQPVGIEKDMVGGGCVATSFPAQALLPSLSVLPRQNIVSYDRTLCKWAGRERPLCRSAKGNGTSKSKVEGPRGSSLLSIYDMMYGTTQRAFPAAPLGAGSAGSLRGILCL
jgi:hypothetical protein